MALKFISLMLVIALSMFAFETIHARVDRVRLYCSSGCDCPFSTATANATTATANATNNGTTKPANASDRYRCRTKIRCPKLKPIYTYIHITNMENVNWEGWGMVYTL